MSDLEISTKIAEIEGGKTFWVPHDNSITVEFENRTHVNYRPFEGTLCFQLMIKYKVYINHSYGQAYIESDHAYAEHKAIAHFSCDDEIGRAICTVIIEANKDDQDDESQR